MTIIRKAKVKRIFGLKELLKILGVSRSWLYSEMSAGRFPRPLQLGPRRVGWAEDDVVGWQESLPSTDGKDAI